MPAVGRNDPCPCGSGKKYKRCCLARTTAQEREATAQRNAAARALVWVKQHHREAFAAAVEEGYAAAALHSGGRWEPAAELGDLLLANNLEWFLAEGEIEDRGEPRRVLDLVLGPGGPLLDSDERRWLQALAGEPLVLLEVQDVEAGRGLAVTKVFDPAPERLWVAERSASRQLVRWDLFAARLVPWQDHRRLSGCFYSFQRRDLPALRDAIEPLLHSPAAGQSPAAAARAAGRVLRELWFQLTFAPPRGLEGLQLIDGASGDPLLLVTDHYRIVDRDGLARALAAQPDVEEDGHGGWMRFEETGGEVRLSLLSLEVVGGDRLKAFARTQRRADAGRAWLAEVAGGSLEFLRRELSDPKALLAQGPDRPRRAPEPAVPMTTELAQAIYERFYRAWASEPIPVLGGKPPGEAVRSPAGRERVIDLLKSYEQGELRRAREESREPASFRFLWEAVGLDRESILG